MTTPLLPIQYQLDKTGVNPANLIQNEIHVLSNMTKRCISPFQAPFFSDSVIIKDIDDNNRVLASNEYSFFLLQSVPSELIGKSVYGIIIITNTSVSNNVSVTYQVLGGEYSRTYTPTKQMIDILLNDNGPVLYNNILNKPETFDPVHHLHSMDDSVGYEYILSQLERLRATILIKNDLNIENILRYLDTRVENLNTYLNQNVTTINQSITQLNTLLATCNTDSINILGQFTSINNNLLDSTGRANILITNYQNGL